MARTDVIAASNKTISTREDLLGGRFFVDGSCGEKNFESLDFLPDWFLEPLDAKLALQLGLAHTQMLCSFIHKHRDANAHAGAA